jgi:hypothetical protein
MLVFIIPLRSAQVSSSWKQVCLLLERTLKSVCNQTCSEFKVIVVCHEKPDIQFNHPSVSYLCVDFPAPVETAERADDQALIRKRYDKNRKLFLGLVEAQSFNPSHAMLVDSDDLVSRNLAEFVKNNPHSNGWFVNQGYEYEEGTDLIKPRKNLHQRTGTSHIIRFEALKADLSKDLSEIDDQYLAHQAIVPWMASRGNPLAPLPFAGSIYITNNGENIWAQKGNFFQRRFTLKSLVRFYGGKLNKFLITRPLTEPICDEFGLYLSNTSTHKLTS